MRRTNIYLGIDIGSTTVKVLGVNTDTHIVGQPVYLRLDQFSTQVDAVKHAMLAYLESVSGEVAGVGVTGSGRELYRSLLGADLSHTEIFAHAVGVAHLVQTGEIVLGDNLSSQCPGQVGSVIEIGGQDSKIITFGVNNLPAFFNMNTICSAGTGEFLKQLADEAGTTLHDFGFIALQSRLPATIDATCTVFSKRDFRHLTQKGVPLADRLMGACHALVRNYMNNVAQGVTLTPPIFFQGGVAHNTAVKKAFEIRLGMPVHVTPHNGVVGALGMAVSVHKHMLQAGSTSTKFRPDFFTRQFASQVRYCHGCSNGCDLAQPVEVCNGTRTVIETLGGRCDGCKKAENVQEVPAQPVTMVVPVARNIVNSPLLDLIHAGGKPVRSSQGHLFAGLDGGSRGTKYALVRILPPDRVVNPALEILTAGTVDTAGDAVTAGLRALKRLQQAMPAGETLAGIGTTGSAGELLRDIITSKATDTADHRCTEVVAHYVWASYWQPGVGTVMDIGGNDAKIIVAHEGSLDFAMNDKCAAGTGSFLEAVARRFGVPITEFASLALTSHNPARVAGRCAVFGESDIVHKSRLGFASPDLFLGLAFAVCRTYLSDVARGKPLRVPIVAQGGTFLNAAVQKAFRDTLQLSPAEFIIAPDDRYVLCAGALGAALMACGKWEQGYNSHFKGFSTIFTQTYSTTTTVCRLPGCHRSCQGVVALLENGRPIAGYRAVDCALGHFAGLAVTPEETDHIQRMLVNSSNLNQKEGA